MTPCLRTTLVTALSVALVCMLVSLALPPVSAQASASSASVVKRINSIRHAHGLRALKVSYSLERSARGYAGRMLRRGYFGHQSRIQASGRRFGYLGEVLARSRTASRAGAVVRAWMNSRTHRAVLMNPRYRYVGIGRGRGRTLGNVVVGHFGAR